MPRVRADETPCAGTWPRTGQACRNPARTGRATCAAHDPDGDQRPAPPPDEARCQAANKESGERCRKRHDPGATVCGSHGGAASQVRAAAEVRILHAELHTLAANLVGHPVENPLEELGRVAGRLRAWTELLEDRVQNLLTARDNSGQADGNGEGIRYEARSGEQIRGEVQLYERSIVQFGNLLTAIARLDIDRRLTQIEQDKVDLIARAVDAAIREAGLSGEQVTAAKRSVARHLRSAG